MLSELRSRPRLAGLLVLLLLGALMLATDPWFSVIDDEVAMLASVQGSMGTLIDKSLGGERPHAHPPLHDLLVKVWLRVSGAPPDLLRLPAVALYLAGLWFCARAAERLAGAAGWWTGLLAGFFWPHGFHLGRLQGWYVLSFFFAAWLTFEFLSSLDEPGRGAWVRMFLAGCGLIYTNYFGWAMIGLLAVLYFWETRQDRRYWRAAAATLLAWFVVFSPMLPPLLLQLGTEHFIQGGWSGRLAYGAYNAYALLAGESVAPWFLPLGVPMAAALALVYALSWLESPSRGRFLFLGAFVLVGVMTVLGIVATKRILTEGPWMLVPLAAAMAGPPGHWRRSFLQASWAAVILCAVTGGFLRDYYAAPRWVEPWREIAQREVAEIQNGTLLIASHPALSYYLTYELRLPANPGTWRFAGLVPIDIPHPQFFEPQEWQKAGRPLRPRIQFIRSASREEVKPYAREAEAWLRRSCELRDTERHVPDAGFAWKQHLFPGSGQLAWRVEILDFSCDIAPHT